MNGEIICVGTELLLGNIVNTNARFLSEELASLGISVYNQSVVGDNESRIKQALAAALKRSQIVILTGGLGPTEDDITKESVSSFFSLKLKEDEESRNNIDKYFQRTGRRATQNNYKQALIPVGARIFKNDIGTAPGCAIEYSENTVIILPGPPSEMETMFLNYAKPYLHSKTRETIVSHKIRVFGEPESAVEEKIKRYTKLNNPTLAIYASEGEISLRFTAKAHSKVMADHLCQPVIDTVKNTLGDSVYGVDCGEIQNVVVELLREKHLKISTAESCTAGLLSSMITEVAGASEVFDMGVSAYANDIKTTALGVPASVIERHGAVSQHTAAYMAMGIRKLADADIGIGITGVAGPACSENKPVGLVYIALADKNNIWIRRATFGHGNNERDKVRTSAAKTALDLLRRYLCSLPEILEGGFPIGSAPTVLDAQPKIAKAKNSVAKATEPTESLQMTFSDQALADMINTSSDEGEYPQISEENIELYKEIGKDYISITEYDDDDYASGKKGIFRRRKGYSDTPIYSAEMITTNQDSSYLNDSDDAEGTEISGFLRFISTIVPWKNDKPMDVIRKILFIISFVGLVLSSVFLIKYFTEQRAADNVTKDVQSIFNTVKTLKDKDDNGQFLSFRGLLAKNKDTMGWITVNGTPIDNPVVLCDNNEYYLNHNFNKEKSRYGTLYFDCNSEINNLYNSQNLIIYGHDMKDGSMFGSLKRYKNLNFYRENPIIKLKTLYGDAKYKIFAIMLTSATPETINGYTFDYRQINFADQQDFLRWTRQAKMRSIINTNIDVMENDDVITLSTCSNDFPDARLVILARKIRVGEYSNINTSDVSVNRNTLYPQAYYDKKGLKNPFVSSIPSTVSDYTSSVDDVVNSTIPSDIVSSDIIDVVSSDVSAIDIPQQ